MTSAQLVDLKGKKLGEVTLEDSVFGGEPNTHLLHSALMRQLANARAGTASTKTRSEVRGGGRKPWRQKGTGRARAGSIRSPLWEGGGVTFGPKPRDYTISMPKKMRQLALKSALAARVNDLVVVKDFAELKEPKTRLMAAVLKDLQLHGKKVLLVMDFSCSHCQLVERAARNIAGLKVLNSNNLNVKDLLDCDAILTTERTLEQINNRFKHGTAAETAAQEAPARQSKKKAPQAPAAEPTEQPGKQAAEAPAPKTAGKKKSEGDEPAPKASTRKKKEERDT
ncbi:MAG TPA: 50S ribosomal protein L4 [Candidatus Obscuribacterales bacterium]